MLIHSRLMKSCIYFDNRKTIWYIFFFFYIQLKKITLNSNIFDIQSINSFWKLSLAGRVKIKLWNKCKEAGWSPMRKRRIQKCSQHFADEDVAVRPLFTGHLMCRFVIKVSLMSSDWRQSKRRVHVRRLNVPEMPPAGWELLVGWFAGIYPITVDIDGLWQVGDGSLEFFQADCAWYYTRIPAPLHLDIAGLLVVAERTCELSVQVPC